MKDFKDFTRERSDREVLKRLFAYLKPHKKYFIWTLVFMAVSLLVQLLPPYLIGRIVDVIGDDELARASKERTIITIAAFFAGLIVISNSFVYYQNYWLQRIGQKIVAKMRIDVFEHIESLAIGQINEVPVGKLVTRVANDTNVISEMYTNVAVNLIRNFLYLLGILIVLFLLNWRITLALLGLIPLVILASVIFRKYSRASFRWVRSNVAEVNAFLSENLSGMKVTQIFNQEDKKKREFYERNDQLEKSYLREILVFGIYRPTIYGFAMTGVVIALLIGIRDVLDPTVAFTAGMLFSYYMYVQDFFQPIQQMAEQFNMLQNAFASAEKIFDVLDTKPALVDADDAIELESFSGAIEFKDVWFQYIEDEWVLKGVSFRVNPGDTVAFVGATGSGKTTILNLIVRNYDIQKGQILIDGIDIQRIKRSSLRRHIGQMLQDVFLFSGTIKDNITLNDPDITTEEVRKAAEYVGADGFIESLPDGYEHVVRERGNNFSSGQRQLISFARALVYKPSLMILDEATANIDSETEELIQESLIRMMNISTMIIVAHRLSTIQHADRIIVMKKGEIKETGTHQQLLRHRGLYYHLYR
ncbi:MAG: ABC transporter ATP-binding protein, partial [Acholeplasmataceae bacterium]